MTAMVKKKNYKNHCLFNVYNVLFHKQENSSEYTVKLHYHCHKYLLKSNVIYKSCNFINIIYM